MAKNKKGKDELLREVLKLDRFSRLWIGEYYEYRCKFCDRLQKNNTTDEDHRKGCLILKVESLLKAKNE